ncbi:MAG: polynucleotide adenylyltransferase PcnB, partial [Hydrogenophaga sp.]|nr:polynucleotide adenylyltransferase PcnB [Hydrogenophaga sp.]
AADMREIWVMQPRFEKRAGRVPESMVAQLRFRAGFDFMRLRADVGEVDEALADWWQQFSTADEAEREDLMEQAREEQKARTRAAQPVVRRVPRAAPADPRGLAPEPAGESDSDDGAPPAPENFSEGGAPKKRRRRRRKPGGAATGGEPGPV